MPQRLSAILLFAVLILAACSGGDDPQPQSEYFFKFKVNGVQKEFKANLPTHLMAMTYNATADVHMATAIILGDGSDGTKNFVSITALNEEPFATGITYRMQEAILYTGVPVVRIQFTYSDEDGNLYNAVLFQRDGLPMLRTDDASIHFSSITQTKVEGTFDATVLGPVFTTTGRDNNELKITEGQFSLQLQRSGS